MTKEKGTVGVRQLLSICIVAYNNYDQIKTALASIERNTSPTIDKKIFISDNSESHVDRTSFLEFISEYDDIEYIDNQANLGFGKGHNVVKDIIESDYHAIVNPDVEIFDDAFASILAFMSNSPDVGMVIPRIISADGELQDSYRAVPTVLDMFIRMFCKKHFLKRQAEHSLKHMDFTKPFQVPFAQGCFLVIRTELFKKLGGFDDRFFMYMEDADLSRRVNQQSSVMYFPEATVVHAWERASHKSKKLFKIHVNSMLKYFCKWGWKLF